MMKTSFSQDVWEALHLVEGWVKNRGYMQTSSPAPELKAAPIKSNGPIAQDFAQLLDKITASRAGEDSAHLIRGIPGLGNPSPKLLILAPNPEAQELEEKSPLGDEERVYLIKWLTAIGLDLFRDTYLINLFIPSQGGNQDKALLFEFVDFLRPKAIFCLGAQSAQALVGSPVSLRTLRGHDYNYHGYPLVPTYHPRDVLDDQSLKKMVWADLQRVQGILEYEGR